MNIRSHFSMTFAVIILGACASAPPRPATTSGDDYAYTRSYMRWMITEQMREHAIVGLSIALVDDQRIAWSEGFGYADEKNRNKATPDTIYRAGSIAKLFTATAAMQLSDQNRIDIDQPLQRYIPGFAIRSRFESAESITPRNIMTHHSGLPTNYHNRMWGDDTATVTQLADDLKDEYVANAPNIIGAYSNIGFALLGHAIEKISGMTYARYVEEHILRPLDMRNSYVSANLNIGGLNAKGYFNQKEHASLHLRDMPAGALNTSVTDLARFAQMTFGGGQRNNARILEPATLAQMQRYQDGDADFDVRQEVGLAWRLDERLGADAGIVASHNGGTPMFFSEFLTLPAQKLAVVVLANSNTAAGVVAKIANETLKLAYESKTGIRTVEPADFNSTLPALAVDLQRLPGFWSTSMGLVHISRRADRLKFEVNGTRLNLVRREDGHYHLQYKLLGLLSVDMGEIGRAGVAYRNIAGRDLLVLYRGSKPVSVIAEKLDPEPLPKMWERRLGKYESTNANGNIDLKQIRLGYADGLLQAKFSIEADPGGTESFTEALRPVSDSQAVIQGLGRSKGDAVQFVEIDGETRLSYSGFLLRRID